MTPLSPKDDGYPAPKALRLPHEKARAGYFPDDIIEALIGAASDRDLPTFGNPAKISGPFIDPAMTRELVSKSLHGFFEPFGKKADAFFDAGYDTAIQQGYAASRSRFIKKHDRT